MAVIDQYFKYLVEAGGSDLHLSEGQPPKVRVNGTISAISDENLEGQAFKNLLAEICDPQAFQKYLEEGDLDFAYEMDETSRFRCNYFKQQHGLGAVFRLIPTKIATLEELGVPTVVKEFAHMRSGLVLVTGVMGSGKTTLLAAILRHIIEKGGRNVATYESPIEFDLLSIPNQGGPVSQSTIPEHLQSFIRAVRNSTRTAPNVVLIGESRDAETLRGMIESVETGVAAYSTVHTRSVPETLSRIINVFPVEERLQVTVTLLSSLRLVVNQRLVPMLGGKGRVALREFLAFTPEIREVLLDTPPERLIQTCETLLIKYGQRMQDAAQAAYDAGKITKENTQAIMAERKTSQPITKEEQ